MPDRGQYCPFLNRADLRCSEHFSLDELQYAFDHCFGQYHACPVYLELLAERRVRRAPAYLEATGPFAGALAGPDADTDGGHDEELAGAGQAGTVRALAAHGGFVQLTVGLTGPSGPGHPAGRRPHPGPRAPLPGRLEGAAGAGGLSHAPRL